ncbi:hypothetical protein D3C86_1783980 [compost metagenome]
MGRADPQHAAGAVLAQAGEGLVVEREHLPGMAQQLAAGIGQGLVATLLAQQRHAHLLLQALHVLGHRSLGAAQVPASLGEA